MPVTTIAPNPSASSSEGVRPGPRGSTRARSAPSPAPVAPPFGPTARREPPRGKGKDRDAADARGECRAAGERVPDAHAVSRILKARSLPTLARANRVRRQRFEIAAEAMQAAGTRRTFRSGGSANRTATPTSANTIARRRGGLPARSPTPSRECSGRPARPRAARDARRGPDDAAREAERHGSTQIEQEDLARPHPEHLSIAIESRRPSSHALIVRPTPVRRTSSDSSANEAEKLARAERSEAQTSGFARPSRSELDSTWRPAARRGIRVAKGGGGAPGQRTSVR